MSLDKFAHLLKELQEEHEANAKLSGVNDRILVIDGLNTFIRAWTVVPSLNDDGEHVGGVTGYLKSVGALIRQFKPTRCIMVFDGKGGSQRRKKLLPEYKAGRRGKLNINRAEHMVQAEDEELRQMRLQIQRLSMYLEMLPVNVLSIDNIEADDVISYIATEVYKDSEIIISSSDKDFLHLIDDRVKVWAPMKKQLMDNQKVMERYDIPAHNFLLYRTFDGDKSDNIGGVNGVGKKSLIKHIPMITEDKEISIDDVIEYAKQQIADGSKYGVFKKIVDGEDTLKRNWRLMSLREHDFSASTKTLIRRILESEINPLNRREFNDTVIVDKIYNAIPNVNSWLTSTFTQLEEFAKTTRK
jgi:5'-3' exonuclease